MVTGESLALKKSQDSLLSLLLPCGTLVLGQDCGMESCTLGPSLQLLIDLGAYAQMWKIVTSRGSADHRSMARLVVSIGIL